MADRTPIEWTDATWNVINGCSVVSPGCTNCYAMRLAGTRFRNHPTRQGLTTDSKAGPVWNGQVRFNEKVLTDPLRWTRPRRIFVCAHGDLFHENVPDEWIDRVFAVMALADRHVFQILTKRPERMRAYFAATTDPAMRFWYRVDQQMDLLAADLGRWKKGTDYEPVWPLPNVWLGVSAEDQARADERIPILLDTPAAVRWLSAEPLLGPINFRRLPGLPTDDEDVRINALEGRWRTSPRDEEGTPMPRLDWVVAGGESGPGARPMHPDWARQLRDQCADADVPFLFKQWGDWIRVDHEEALVRSVPADCLRIVPEFGPEGGDIACEALMERVGKKRAGRQLDGRLHDGFPTTGAGGGA